MPSFSASNPQITLYSHNGGPNGWKVAIVLEELGLTYRTIYLDFQKGEHKQAPYTKFNPNGRVPTIVDHGNNDFTLWESCAIIEYLTEMYDPEHKISASTANDRHIQRQYLFFQASGQGPYFGQAAWFGNFHPEKLPSAIERYQKEIKRVLGVLEQILSTSKNGYLVDGRVTVADISFLTWNNAVSWILGAEFNFQKEFPTVFKWINDIKQRPAVAKVLAEKESLQQKH